VGETLSHWCDVHEVFHPNEKTFVYEIEKDKGPNIWLTLCNLVAMTLGLTQKDVVPDE
jgi:hypothetical protein